MSSRPKDGSLRFHHGWRRVRKPTVARSYVADRWVRPLAAVERRASRLRRARYTERMRWDRDYTSADVEDRRAEEGAGLGGGGGGAPVWLIFRLFSLFGWKGVLVGAVIAGAV